MVEWLWFVYGVVAFGIFVSSLTDYDRGMRKKGARKILAAPVWPAVLLLFMIRDTIRFIREVWQDANLF